MEDEGKSFRSPREERFYNRLRAKVTHWAEERKMTPKRLQWLLAAPDLFALLSRLALDGRVSANAKGKILVGVAYFLSPVDLIPDFIVPVGFLDDVLVAGWILYRLTAEINALDPSILTEHWEGEEDVLQLVRDISLKGERVLGRTFQIIVAALRRVMPESGSDGGQRQWDIRGGGRGRGRDSSA